MLHSWINVECCDLSPVYCFIPLNLLNFLKYTVKKVRRFYGKDWQLAARAFTVTFTEARKSFIGI